MLAFVFCICTFNVFLSVSEVSADGEYRDRTVRVGLYYNTSRADTTRFSSKNTSSTNGFEVGYSVNSSFRDLFSISSKSVIILPQMNANLNLSSGSGSATSVGNVGAYSAIIGSFSTAEEAFSAASAYPSGFVAVVKGGFEARSHPSLSAAKVTEASGNPMVSHPVSGGLTVVDAKTGRVVFTFEDVTRRFAIRAKNGGSVAIPTGDSTLRNYLGFFEYSVSGGKLWMINCLPLETYTKCVMSVEIGTNYSVENRKAFSLLIRTYAIAGKHGSSFNVCPTTCCQVYPGTFRMSEENNKIVDSTRGMYLTYDGRPISAQYHVSNGGATCSSLAAWGSKTVPYLTTVFQPENNGGLKWTHTYTKEEFFKYLKSRSTFSSLSDSDITMKILKTDPYGSDYVTHLSVTDGSGNTVEVKSAEKVRTALAYKSANFDVEYTAEVKVLGADGKVTTKEISGVLTEDGYKPFESFADSYLTTSGETLGASKITITGAGSGHGVGYSVWGAEQLARDGYNFKHILNVYYQGTTISKVS